MLKRVYREVLGTVLVVIPDLSLFNLDCFASPPSAAGSQ